MKKQYINLNFTKKLFIMLLTVCMILPTLSSGKIHAYENDNFSTSYIEDGYKYNISVENGNSTVMTESINTGDVQTIMYDSSTGLIYEDGIVIGSGSGEIISTRASYGPFRFNYNISVATVAAIASSIVAVASIASGLAAGAVSVSLFKNAIEKLLDRVGRGTAADYLLGGLSVNGYFTFKQEISGTLTRNINRKIYLRFAKNKYYSHDFPNSGWFSSTKPYTV